MADRDFVVKNGLVVSNSVLRIANNVGFMAQGSLGAPGQKLTSNGSAVYWMTDTGQANTNFSFTWNVPQYFSGNVTIQSSADLVLYNGASIWAQGSKGGPGYIMTSDGENVYWNPPAPPALVRDSNLADVPNKAAGRANLGLGDSATRNVGFSGGQVPPGDATPARDGTYAYGTWNINIYGNAGGFTSTAQNSQFNSVGVGVTPSGAAGDFRATGDVTAFFTSDRTLKKNIKRIENAIDKLMSIGGYEYDWTDEYIKSKGEPDGYFIRTHDVGVISQEIEKVLPEAVATRQNGIKATNYEKIIPLLIEGFRSLKLEIEDIKKALK